MDYRRSNKSKSEIESRIRESEDSCQVKAHSKPWVVRLIVAVPGGIMQCGGTLIGTKTVVTAAHCVCKPYTNICNLEKDITLIMGDHHMTRTDCRDQITRPENEQCFIGVKSAQAYKEWNGNVYFPFVFNYILPIQNPILSRCITFFFFKKGFIRYGNDIALIAVDRKVTLNQKVQIARLPNPDAPCPDGMNLVVAGWGAYVVWGDSAPDLDYRPIVMGEPSHEYLWAVKQKCLDKEDCDKKIYKLNNVTIPFPDSVLCSVGPRTSGLNGPYAGDSGGTE